MNTFRNDRLWFFGGRFTVSGMSEGRGVGGCESGCELAYRVVCLVEKSIRGNGA